MGGKYELTNTGGHKDESHNPFKSYSSTAEMKDKDALLKRFDIGVQGGIGFEIWKHYLINASFQHGFMDRSKEGHCMPVIPKALPDRWNPDSGLQILNEYFI